jgi:hypothetical protein
MNQDTIFTNIQQLLPILREFQEKGTALINNDQRLLLKDTYIAVMGYVQMDVACSSCVIHYLNILASYQDREYPKFLEAQLAVESAIRKNKKKKDE